MFNTHPLGHLYQKNGLTVFFGGRDSKTDEFRKIFPQWKFFRLKQVHGNVVHSVDSGQPDMKIEGDASVTVERNLSLCSISADCMPVFIFNPERQMIAAVHAGWRGIAKRVIPATIERMKAQGADPRQNTYFIGPHILKSSFEVENTVRDELLRSTPRGTSAVISETTSNAKSIVDLLALAELQVQEYSIDSNIIKLAFDTKTDLRYHSFRRDKDMSGRQVSFICLS